MSSRSLWVSEMILLWSAATCRRFGVGPGSGRELWTRRSGSQCLLTAFFHGPGRASSKGRQNHAGQNHEQPELVGLGDDSALECGDLSPLWSWPGKRQGAWTRRSGSQCILTAFPSCARQGFLERKTKSCRGNLDQQPELVGLGDDSALECGDLSPLWSWPGKRQGAWTRRSGSQCILTAFSFTAPGRASSKGRQNHAGQNHEQPELVGLGDDSALECGDLSPLWSWPGKRQGAWTRRSGSQCILTAFSFMRPAGLPRKKDKIMQGKIMSSRSLWVSEMILLWSAATCRRFGVGPGSGRQRGAAAVDRSVSLPLFLSCSRPAGLPRKEDKMMQGKIMSSRSLWVSEMISASGVR